MDLENMLFHQNNRHFAIILILFFLFFILTSPVLFQLTQIGINLHHFLVCMTHQLFQVYHLHMNTNSKHDFSAVS